MYVTEHDGHTPMLDTQITATHLSEGYVEISIWLDTNKRISAIVKRDALSTDEEWALIAHVDRTPVQRRVQLYATQTPTRFSSARIGISQVQLAELQWHTVEEPSVS